MKDLVDDALTEQREKESFEERVSELELKQSGLSKPSMILVIAGAGLIVGLLIALSFTQYSVGVDGNVSFVSDCNATEIALQHLALASNQEVIFNTIEPVVGTLGLESNCGYGGQMIPDSNEIIRFDDGAVYFVYDCMRQIESLEN